MPIEMSNIIYSIAYSIISTLFWGELCDLSVHREWAFNRGYRMYADAQLVNRIPDIWHGKAPRYLA